MKVPAPCILYYLLILKTVKKESIENSCYELDVMKNSHSE
jgi:hypothetical protein